MKSQLYVDKLMANSNTNYRYFGYKRYVTVIISIVLHALIFFFTTKLSCEWYKHSPKRMFYLKRLSFLHFTHFEGYSHGAIDISPNADI